MSYKEWCNTISNLASQSTSLPTTNNDVLFDLTPFGIISIAGADAEKFLQGQLTANVSDLDQQQYRLSAICNPKGRIDSLFTLLKTDQSDDTEYLAILPKTLIESTIQSLKKYSVFFKVTIEDHTTQWGVFGQLSSNAEQLKDTPFISQTWKGGYLLKWPMAQHVLAVLPIEEAIDYCKTTSFEALKTYEQWHLSEIKAGIARVYPETVGQLLPHYIDLPELKAVSFDKGCFTGQEVIARMHYKGKLKSHLYYLSGALDNASLETAQPNTEVMADNKKIGTVITSVIDGDKIHLLTISQDLILSATKIQCNQENAPILHVNEFSNRTFVANT